MLICITPSGKVESCAVYFTSDVSRVVGGGCLRPADPFCSHVGAGHAATIPFRESGNINHTRG